MAKIAVSSEGPGLEDMVDPRFGRAGGFVIIDTGDMETAYIDNGNAQSMSHGAGIAAAENIAKAGAEVLLTGIVGPKAFMALAAAGVRIVEGMEGLTVGQAVERYKSGDTVFADAPGGGPRR